MSRTNRILCAAQYLFDELDESTWEEMPDPAVLYAQLDLIYSKSRKSIRPKIEIPKQAIWILAHLLNYRDPERIVTDSKIPELSRNMRMRRATGASEQISLIGAYARAEIHSRIRRAMAAGEWLMCVRAAGQMRALLIALAMLRVHVTRYRFGSRVDARPALNAIVNCLRDEGN